MAPKGRPKQPDRHRVSPISYRPHPLLRKQLDILVERNVSTLAAEITIAIRKHLAENGLWPPPPAAK